MLHQRFTSPFKKFGMLAGLGYIIDRALLALPGRMRLHVYDFMVQPITEKALLPERLFKSVEVRALQEGDPEIELIPRPAAIKADRFDQGAECLGAFSKGQLIAYMWFNQGGYREDEVRCDYKLVPPDESVFDFDVFVFPESRMGLAFAGLWTGANKLLYNRGIRYSFSRLNRFNAASKKSHDRLGWWRAASAIIFKAWGIELMMVGIRPYLSLSLKTTSRPCLQIYADSKRPDYE